MVSWQMLCWRERLTSGQGSVLTSLQHDYAMIIRTVPRHFLRYGRNTSLMASTDDSAVWVQKGATLSDKTAPRMCMIWSNGREGDNGLSSPGEFDSSASDGSFLDAIGKDSATAVNAATKPVRTAKRL